MRVHFWVDNRGLGRADNRAQVFDTVYPQRSGSFNLDQNVGNLCAHHAYERQNVLPQWLAARYDQQLVFFNAEHLRSVFSQRVNWQNWIVWMIKIRIAKRAS